MESLKRVGIFLRVSTDMQVNSDSLEHHEKRARYYIESKGWEALEVYRLDSVSGKSVMNHPETKRMLADIRSGHISGLVFSKLARLARNTKELLEFADLFREAHADLISLGENIDTSSPAGRLFFTVISALTEFEREEIASRVAASVPIRAKLGKPLGGQASFGYAWVNKQLVINEQEAPIRKLVYELFLQHQRKKTTATALNKLGYRTRKGSLFSDSTIVHLLRDPAAKGERRAAYTKSTGRNKKWSVRPEAEWIKIPCPAIVSSELWNQCNHILDEQERAFKKPGPKAVHLLSGFIKCTCGKSMYVFHSSMVYTCKECKNRIAVNDIDEIYQAHLRDYLSSIDTTAYLAQSDQQLQEKKQLLEAATKERARLSKYLNTILALRVDGELSKERFKEQYDPLEAQLTQLDAQLPMLEAEIDVRTIHLYSSETVFEETRNLYEQWPTMPFEQKRAIVETITKQIEVGTGDINITLAYIPPPLRNDGKRQHNNIVAGMADATVVIEASIKGGALITAEIANSYNRDVFTFPGRVGDEFSEGCNFLIRYNKAALLTSAADLANSLGWEKNDGTKLTGQITMAFDLSADEQLIFETIKQHKLPLAIDDLTLKTNMPVSLLAMNLLNMEMQGYIRSLPGKTYLAN